MLALVTSKLIPASNPGQCPAGRRANIMSLPTIDATNRSLLSIRP